MSSSLLVVSPSKKHEKVSSASSEIESCSWGQVFEPVRAAERVRWIHQCLFQRLSRWVAKQIMHLIALIWFNITVNGKEHLPKGGFVLASNHSSHFDTVALIHAMGKRGFDLFMLAARDYFFRNSWRTWFFRNYFQILPFDRHGEDRLGLNLANEVIKAGHPLLIYPEGTRSSDGQVQLFKPGVGLLGVELGVPIVPCLILGTFLSLPKGKWWPRRAKVSVTFGQPLEMDEFRTLSNKTSRCRLYRHVSGMIHQQVLLMADETSNK